MDINCDFRDLLCAFNADGVRYLIVGGLAPAFHDRPRFTKDLDVWVEPTTENALRVYRALAEFGTPLDSVTVSGITSGPGCYSRLCPTEHRNASLRLRTSDHFEASFANPVVSLSGAVDLQFL